MKLLKERINKTFKKKKKKKLPIISSRRPLKS